MFVSSMVVKLQGVAVKKKKLPLFNKELWCM